MGNAVNTHCILQVYREPNPPPYEVIYNSGLPKEMWITAYFPMKVVDDVDGFAQRCLLFHDKLTTTCARFLRFSDRIRSFTIVGTPETLKLAPMIEALGAALIFNTFLRERFDLAITLEENGVVSYGVETENATEVYRLDPNLPFSPSSSEESSEENASPNR